jgi:hypothetical protein
LPWRIQFVTGRIRSNNASTILLNTDDVEPDRYSANPLRESIVSSGQSAFTSASVKTDELRIDQNFINKYEGKLISKGEVELIKRHLETSNNSYVDMVDAVKYEQLKHMSEIFGIDLGISAFTERDREGLKLQEYLLNRPEVCRN